MRGPAAWFLLSLMFCADIRANPAMLPSPHVQLAIRYGLERSRGVNLGGWLVLEHWITPQSPVFANLSASELDQGEQHVFRAQMERIGRDRAEELVEQHRRTFITAQDIAEIAAAGINTVRVPVGYWILETDRFDRSQQRQYTQYARGALAHLDRLIREWCSTYNIAVLISMHAAKGSQNGAEHSSPEQLGHAFWAQYPENIESTLDVVAFLAARYQHEPAFLGISLLNEPSGATSVEQLRTYYERAYRAIRVNGRNDCILAIAPLLQQQSANETFASLGTLLTSRNTTNIWVEWHRYFIWGLEDKSEDELLQVAIPQFRDDVEAWHTLGNNSNALLFIGEFSLATAGKFHEPKRLARFGQLQMDVLERNVDGGWAFWTWRMGGHKENNTSPQPWSLQSLLRHGIFPRIE